MPAPLTLPAPTQPTNCIPYIPPTSFLILQQVGQHPRLLRQQQALYADIQRDLRGTETGVDRRRNPRRKCDCIQPCPALLRIPRVPQRYTHLPLHRLPSTPTLSTSLQLPQHPFPTKVPLPHVRPAPVARGPGPACSVRRPRLLSFASLPRLLSSASLPHLLSFASLPRLAPQQLDKFEITEKIVGISINIEDITGAIHDMVTKLMSTYTTAPIIPYNGTKVTLVEYANAVIPSYLLVPLCNASSTESSTE